MDSLLVSLINELGLGLLRNTSWQSINGGWLGSQPQNRVWPWRHWYCKLLWCKANVIGMVSRCVDQCQGTTALHSVIFLYHANEHLGDHHQEIFVNIFSLIKWMILVVTNLRFSKILYSTWVFLMEGAHRVLNNNNYYVIYLRAPCAPPPKSNGGPSTTIVITSTSVLSRVAHIRRATKVRGHTTKGRLTARVVKVRGEWPEAEATVVAEELTSGQGSRQQHSQSDNELETKKRQVAGDQVKWRTNWIVDMDLWRLHAWQRVAKSVESQLVLIRIFVTCRLIN